MDLAPRFASSLFVSVRHSVLLGARLSPFAVGVSTTLFDAEERLLKRSRKAPRCPRIDLDHKRISETRVRTVSSTAPGQGKGVGEEPPFPRPVTKGLGQSHIVGGSYVYVAAPIGPGLSEKTNWERRGDKKHLLPENRLRIRMLPAGSRPIEKQTRQAHQEICQWKVSTDMYKAALFGSVPIRVTSSMNRQVSDGCAWGWSLDGLAIKDR